MKIPSFLAAACLYLAVGINSWSPTILRNDRKVTGYKRSTGLAAESVDTTDHDDDTVYYQSNFYRFTTHTDADIPNAAVIEERCRLCKDPRRPGYIIPESTTLLLRDGQVNDGEIGPDWISIPISSSDNISISTIAMALYLTCNPNLVSGGKLWHLGGDTSLATVLGVLGAARVLQGSRDDDDSSPKGGSNDVTDDILTISKQSGRSRLPKELEQLVLADRQESSLRTAMDAAKHLGILPTQIKMEPFDWRARPAVQPRGSRQRDTTAYRTIVASELGFSYPEAKELARNVANRLEASSFYLTNPDPTIPLPRFVYICEEEARGDEEVPYLRRLLEKGYRMATSTHYVMLEKISFKVQKLPADHTEDDINDLELEVDDIFELPFQCITAQHHPDFVGGGSGELFFPMETGAYDASSTGPWAG